MATILTADASLVVPYLSPWHARHGVARRELSAVTRLPAHVIYESVSSLTRMPHGYATTVRLAVEALEAAFSGEPIFLGHEGHQALLASAARREIGGGAIYDAVIAAAAKSTDARMLTLDHRAERTYRAIGVDYELVG